MYEVRSYGYLVVGDATPGFRAFTDLVPAVSFGRALLSDETVFVVLIHDLIAGGCIIGLRNFQNEVTWLRPSAAAIYFEPNSGAN